MYENTFFMGHLEWGYNSNNIFAHKKEARSMTSKRPLTLKKKHYTLYN